MNKFRNSIPESVLQNPQTSQFVDVLDGVLEDKQGIVSASLRFYEIATLTDKNMVMQHLKDYGIELPYELPLEVLIQVLLNADKFCGMRGSKIGIEFFCSVLSLGEVTVNDSNFYWMPSHLILDSLRNGHIADNSSTPYFNIISDNDMLVAHNELTILIKSKYFNGSYAAEAAAIQQYINNNIISQLGFCQNLELTLTFQSRNNFYYHNLLNSYFV